VKLYTSKVYEDIRKEQSPFYMPTENCKTLCGDVKVVFYNNSRMKKKVY